MGRGAWEKVFLLMALLALLITFGLQLAVISVDFLIVVKFLPLSNKQLRTHGKNFQGSHANGTAPESCLVNHEADTSNFPKHHKGLGAAPHPYRCLSVLSRWPVTATAMAAPRSALAASTPELCPAGSVSPVTVTIGNYFALAGFTSGSWRYRPAYVRRASPE